MTWLGSIDPSGSAVGRMSGETPPAAVAETLVPETSVSDGGDSMLGALLPTTGSLRKRNMERMRCGADTGKNASCVTHDAWVGGSGA